MEKNVFNKGFVFVEASKLRPQSKFMHYTPKNYKDEKLMALLKNAINNYPRDFWYWQETSICDGNVKIGNKIIPNSSAGLSYYEWEKLAAEFWYDGSSMLGSINEYVLYLGVLIKNLVKNGWSVEAAWNAVCNEPKKILECKEVSSLIPFMATPKILTNDVSNTVAFYVVNPENSLMEISTIEYETMSEYEMVKEMFYKDCPPPIPGSYDPLASIEDLCKGIIDVKGVKRKEFGWFILYN